MDIFKTSRLTIREVSINDIEKLASILSDESTMKYTATGAQNNQQIIDFIKGFELKYRDKDFAHWAIYIKSTNELVGLCGLNQHQVDEEKHVHVNYRLDSNYQGVGLATEAVIGVKIIVKHP